MATTSCSNMGHSDNEEDGHGTACQPEHKSERASHARSGPKFSQPSEASLSNQLLYAEKYYDCYQEQRLKIVPKEEERKKSRCQTFEVPQSSVLSRLKDFLPQMSKSNKHLAAVIGDDHESASKVNVEHIESTDTSVIEMNLSFVPSELLGNGDSSEDESSPESESDEDTQVCKSVSDNVESGEENSTRAARVVKPCIEEINKEVDNDSISACR